MTPRQDEIDSEIATLRRAMGTLERRVLDLESARKTVGETTHRLGVDVLNAAGALNERLETLASRFEAHVAERPLAAVRAPARSDRPFLAVIIALELLIVGVGTLWALTPRPAAGDGRATQAKIAAPAAPAAAPLVAPAGATAAPPPTLAAARAGSVEPPAVSPAPDPVAARDPAMDAPPAVKVFYGVSPSAPSPADAKPAGQ